MKWIDIDHSNPKSWPEKGTEVLFDSGEHGAGWGRLWYNSKKQNPCVMVIDSSGEESSEPFSLQERWLDESPDPTPSSAEVYRKALEKCNPRNSDGTGTKWYEYYGTQVQGEGKESFVHSASCYLACKLAEEELFNKITEALSHTSRPEEKNWLKGHEPVEVKGEDWISVEDGFPPKESKFYYWLYCEKYNNYEQGEYDYDGQIFVDKFGARLYHTSHWKIPKPPYKK